MEADIDPDFLEQLRGMEKEERKEVGDLIREICASFGFPHVHAGIGIRDLGKGFYEGRDGLEHRVIFERISARVLYFHMIGNHDDIRRFLKKHR